MHETPTRIWNKAFISIFVTNSTIQCAIQMTNAFVSKYTDSLGASAALVGTVSGMFAVTSLLFKFISGPAIDVWNRKYILMAGTSVMAISFFGYSISSAVWMLALFRMLQGVGLAFTTTCCLTIVADSLPPGKFSSGISIYSLIQATFLAIGPALALALEKNIGYQMTFRINAIIMTCAVLVASQVRTPKHQSRKLHISVHNTIAGEVLLPASNLFLLNMAYSIIGSFVIICAVSRGVDDIGFYFTVYAVTLLISRPIIGKLTDRFGFTKVVVPAMLCFVLSFILLSMANSLPMFLLAAFVSAFGYGACQPAIQTLAMKSVKTERRGAASSTSYIAQDFGALIAPAIAGACADAFGYVAMWRIMTAPIIIAMVITFVMRGRIKCVESAFRSEQNLRNG